MRSKHADDQPAAARSAVSTRTIRSTIRSKHADDPQHEPQMATPPTREVRQAKL
jgi:hypothetical protein